MNKVKDIQVNKRELMYITLMFAKENEYKQTVSANKRYVLQQKITKIYESIQKKYKGLTMNKIKIKKNARKLFLEYSVV